MVKSFGKEFLAKTCKSIYCSEALYENSVGVKEACSEKFKTSLRTRPVQEQILGREFYELEHSKPLFNQQDILKVFNSYNYHVLLITFKLLKLKSPDVSLIIFYHFE